MCLEIHFALLVAQGSVSVAPTSLRVRESKRNIFFFVFFVVTKLSLQLVTKHWQNPVNLLIYKEANFKKQMVTSILK